MKKLKIFFSLLAVPAIIFMNSCSKDEDPTPDNNPNAEIVTSVMTTTNGGNTGTAIVTKSVTTSDGTVKLRLDVTSATDLDRIYILKAEDNGALMPVIAPTLSSITNTYGTFTAGTSESYRVPSSTQSFVIDIPVTIRTTNSAVTDVYYIWVTNGAGSFTKPTKNTVLGSSVITLNYTSAPVVPYSSATLTVGTQSAATESFLVTSGQVSVLSTADYNDSPSSADIRFVTLDGSGKKNNTSTSLYMYSPADITNANPPSDATADFVAATGSRTTTFEAYTVKTFDLVTGADLQAIGTPGANNIQVTAGNTYAFKTNAGKKGVIKINSITPDGDGSGVTANVSIKVLN